MATRLALDFCGGASDLLSGPVQTQHQSHSRHLLTGAASLRDPPMGTGQRRNDHPAGNARGREGHEPSPRSLAQSWELEAELPQLHGHPSTQLHRPLSGPSWVLLQPFLARALQGQLLHLPAGWALSLHDCLPWRPEGGEENGVEWRLGGATGLLLSAPAAGMPLVGLQRLPDGPLPVSGQLHGGR